MLGAEFVFLNPSRKTKRSYGQLNEAAEINKSELWHEAERSMISAPKTGQFLSGYLRGQSLNVFGLGSACDR